MSPLYNPLLLLDLWVETEILHRFAFQDGIMRQLALLYSIKGFCPVKQLPERE
jgi:hypothetical protein